MGIASKIAKSSLFLAGLSRASSNLASLSPSSSSPWFLFLIEYIVHCFIDFITIVSHVHGVSMTSLSPGGCLFDRLVDQAVSRPAPKEFPDWTMHGEVTEADLSVSTTSSSAYPKSISPSADTRSSTASSDRTTVVAVKIKVLGTLRVLAISSSNKMHRP